MSLSSSTPNVMEVDSVHLLHDLARFYDSGTEMVVSEAFGNAVDVESTELKIDLGEDHDGKYIRFINNGPSMSEKDFRNYHVIARSSKTFGKGLGWAGIGAKLYLGSWLESKIITESSDGTHSLASVMFIQENKASWKFVKPTQNFVGTSYKVYLKPDDYAVLSAAIPDIVLKYFNTAMRNGLDVIINGKKLEYWKPEIIETFNEEIKIDDRHLPFTLWTLQEKIPDNRKNIEYHVSGKRIFSNNPSNLLSNVKREFKKKFCVVVDALCISDQLGTNKNNFRSGIFTSKVEPEIEKQILKILKSQGYLEDPDETKNLKNNFTNKLQRILKENLPWLNPKSICGNMGKGGMSPGKGTKIMQTNQLKIEKKVNEKNERENKSKRSRNRGGFSFITVIKPEDVRQGWMKIETNQIVVNLGHPVAQVMEKSKDAKEYHLCRIISSQLIVLASRDGKLSVEKAFETGDQIFSLMNTESKLGKRSIWNFSANQETRRSKDGKFLPR